MGGITAAHPIYPIVNRIVTLARAASALTGLVFLAFTFGFFFQMPWATRLWPWPDGRLSYIFIASIWAAVTAPLFWLAAIPHCWAAVGGGLNLAIAFAGMAANLAVLMLSGQPQLLVYLAGCAVIALVYVAGALWAWRRPVRDARPMPRLGAIPFGDSPQR